MTCGSDSLAVEKQTLWPDMWTFSKLILWPLNSAVTDRFEAVIFRWGVVVWLSGFLRRESMLAVSSPPVTVIFLPSKSDVIVSR